MKILKCQQTAELKLGHYSSGSQPSPHYLRVSRYKLREYLSFRLSLLIGITHITARQYVTTKYQTVRILFLESQQHLNNL